MTSIVLAVSDGKQKHVLNYAYQDREIVLDAGQTSADIPPLNIRVVTSGQKIDQAMAHEGYAFSPMFTLSLRKKLCEKETMVTWLNLEKKN